MPSSSCSPSAIADAVIAFFAEHEVASLRLPRGWFGRPHDNWHRLMGTTAEDENVLVRLDDKQVLTLQAEAVSSDDRVLRVAIQGGRWDWTEYGGDQEHTEVLRPGNVEFHAPFHPWGSAGSSGKTVPSAACPDVHPVHRSVEPIENAVACLAP